MQIEQPETCSPYLRRDQRLSAMAAALRGLSDDGLDNCFARDAAYAAVGLRLEPTFVVADDSDAASLERVRRKVCRAIGDDGGERALKAAVLAPAADGRDRVLGTLAIGGAFAGRAVDDDGDEPGLVVIDLREAFSREIAQAGRPQRSANDTVVAFPKACRQRAFEPMSHGGDALAALPETRCSLDVLAEFQRLVGAVRGGAKPAEPADVYGSLVRCAAVAMLHLHTYATEAFA